MNDRRSQLVLIGAGHAHLHVLRHWAQHICHGVELILISPYPAQIYSGMIPGWLAGDYPIEACEIPLAPWVKASGARWIQDRCIALNANERTLTLRDSPDKPIKFDWLSIDTGSSMSLQQLEDMLPGAKGRVLPIRPMEQFVQYWDKAVQAAAQRSMAVSVIGAGAAGVELALAAKRKLMATHAHASVTLLSGSRPLLGNYPSGVSTAAKRALARAGVQVLPHRCVEVQDGALVLDNGLRLACDLPIVATGSMAPPWLSTSGLKLDAHGFVAVNAHQQSTSHMRVFAAGDVATRVDAPHPKSGVYAVRSGAMLGQNLWAAIQNLPLQTYTPPQRTLNLLNTSDGSAIASYGPLCASGRWAWRWKDRIDQSFMRAFQINTQSTINKA
jgi:pyridine nucleotide-disulfide oxidoreductase family protein